MTFKAWLLIKSNILVGNRILEKETNTLKICGSKLHSKNKRI
jgi:hypothetical protein